MINEIKSLQDAKERVRDLFGGTTASRLSNPTDIDDYAKIAFFLSSKNEVKTALEEVSKQIWIRYNLPELKQSPNRFSQAIIKYGSDQFGFVVQSNVVFIGALGGPEFMGYVKSGVLWKDTFAPSHGEFSHSFQWFAAGHSLSLGTRIVDLYKRAGSVFSNATDLATRGPDGALLRARQPLWAWLVDCFQPGELEATVGTTAKNHVFSKTYRVPNQINSLAINKTDWFISLYVDHRKQWLAKLAEAGKTMRRNVGETVEPDSNLLGIVKYQGTAYPSKTEWQQQTTGTAPSGKVYKKTASTDTTKGQTAATYHGIEGTVSMLAITSKTLMT
jgi:hypothetical protein